MLSLLSMGRRLPRALRLVLAGLIALLVLLSYYRWRYHSRFSEQTPYYSMPPPSLIVQWLRRKNRPEIQEWRKYSWPTKSIFPPRRRDSQDDFCAGFPAHLLASIKITLKTGIGDSARTRASLEHINSCITNILVVSDAPEVLLFPGGKNITAVDILADLDGDAYARENPDWAAYAPQDNQQHSKEGWRLDRFKFLPMVERAFREASPQTEWFVFIESDIYYFWDTLFRLLEQLDPREEHFLGAPVAGGGGIWFPYGGAGFVLSRAMMTAFIGSGGGPDEGGNSLPLPSVYFTDSVKSDCCGDSALAYAIKNRTGKRLEGLYPIFSGSEARELRIGPENWCVPLLGIHRVQPDAMQDLWKWERTRPYNEDPLYLSTFLTYTHDFLRTDANFPALATRSFWDNRASDEQPRESTAHDSAAACRAACEADRTRYGCAQWSFTPEDNGGTCRFAPAIELGGAIPEREIVSGWNVRRMRELGFNFDAEKEYRTSCQDATWLRPLVL